MFKILFLSFFLASSAFADETVFLSFKDAKYWMWGGTAWVAVTHDDLCYANVQFHPEGFEAVQVSCRGYRAKPRSLLRQKMGIGSMNVDKLDGKGCVHDGRSSIGCTYGDKQ